MSAVLHWDKVVLSIRIDLRSTVTLLDYIHFTSFVDRSVDKLKKNVTVTQKRKFVNLGGSYDPIYVEPEKCIFNLSSHSLSSRESFLLSLGLDFCLPVLRLPKKS